MTDVIVVENILDFPDEILVTIFEYLSPMDRRVACLCCKEFLRIWLSDIFQGDRNRTVIGRLLLTDENQKVLQTFLDTDRIITKLAFNFSHPYNFNAIYPNVRFNSFLDKLWEKLGRTVIEIEISESEELVTFIDDNIWKHFPNLKILKSSIQYLRDYEYLPKTLEKIFVNSEDEEEYSLLKKFLDYKNTSSIFVEMNEPLPYNVFKKHANNFTKMYFDDENNLLEYGIKSKSLNHLEIASLNQLFDKFDILESNYPSLNYLSLLVSEFPATNVSYLKKLEIETSKKFNECGAKLKIFENLEEINFTIKHKNNNCYFGHTPFLNKNLKVLKLVFSKNDNGSCDDCFIAMINSYPNLETVVLGYFSNYHLNIMQTNLPLLKNVSFYVPEHAKHTDPIMLQCIPNLTELRIFGSAVVDIENFPLMKNLRKFKITPQDKEFAKKFSKHTPILEEINITFDETYQEDCEEILELIAKNLKRLRRIDVAVTGSFQFKNIKESVENISKVLMKNCPFIGKFYLEVEMDDYVNEVIFRDSKIISFVPHAQ